MQYDVFISYSRRDYIDENGNPLPENIISKIKDALKKNGITYWIDEDGINSGDEFARLIIRSIKESSVLLFVSTENSNRSEWTRKEIASAIAYKKKIIPFKYDDTPFNDSLLLYLADLDFISYAKTGDKALNRLVTSISKYLEGLKTVEAPEETKPQKAEPQKVEPKKEEPKPGKEEPKGKSKVMTIVLIALLSVAVIYALVVSLESRDSGTKEIANNIEKVDEKIEEQVVATVKEDVKPVETPVKAPVETKTEQPVVKKELKNTTIEVKGVKIDMIAVKGSGKVGDFLIAKYEVTQALWQTVMGVTVAQQRDMLDHSFKLRGEGDNLPMYYISWDDCQEFIKKLNALTGKKFRMPTAAEWERAASAGAQDNGDMFGWCEDNSNGSTHAVGGKRPNALGLYDMIGNVSEWCKDKKEYENVVKGGDWASTRDNCEVADRMYLDSSIRSDATGLRLAL